MSIISQAGVVILILCTLLIILKANKSLEEAAEEGEHFVDEWEERARIKEELALAREAYREKMQEEKQALLMGSEEQEPDGETDPAGENPVMETASMETVPKVECYEQPSYDIILLRINEDRSVAEEIKVASLPFRIGRGEGNDLMLEDLYVARRHCDLIENEDGVFLKDCGTTNRIYSKGQIVDVLRLQDGTDFYLGNVAFHVKMQAKRSNMTKIYNYPGNQSRFA